MFFDPNGSIDDAIIDPIRFDAQQFGKLMRAEIPRDAARLKLTQTQVDRLAKAFRGQLVPTEAE
jgi:cytochrome c556